MNMKYFRQMNYYDRPYYLKDYREEVTPFQKADLAFQANQYSRWEEFQKSCYIVSIILNKAPSKFIFADVDECLKNAEDPDDEKYFQDKKDQGIKYVNIDSNNRNNVIDAFTKNEVKLTHGKYEVQGGLVHITSDNDTYETMPDIMKTAFNLSRIVISVYTDATREELSDLFLVINDGKPLNEPEKLNAYTTKVANIIRELAKDHGDYFANKKATWFTKTNINRRGIDQFISNLAYTYAYGLNGEGISVTSIRNFYRHSSDGERSMSKFKKIFKAFMKNVMTSDAYAIANRNSIFDLFQVYSELSDNNYNIVDNKKFLKKYIQAITKLLKSEERYEDPKFKDPKSFQTMVGGLQQSNNKLRKRLIDENFESKALCRYGDPKRGFNSVEKMIMASDQGWRTPAGENINMSNLHTGDYHGGHSHTPHSQGGLSNLDNGAVQTAEENLKLGANPIPA